MKSARKIVLAVGTFFSFFIFGFVDNVKGPTIPAILREFDFDYSQGGSILLGAYIGFLLATLSSGFLSERTGKKSVMFMAAACIAAGVIGYSFSYSFPFLALGILVIGLGLGSIQVGANAIVIDAYSSSRGRYLNLLTFFHGFGSMMAPLYAGQLLAADVSWRRVYKFLIALPLLLSFLFVLVRYPSKRQRAALSIRDVGKAALRPEILICSCIVACYVAAELGISSWMVEFLQADKSQSVALSSTFLTVYFACITAGRFIGSFIVERIGYVRILLYASTCAVACIVVGIFGPQPVTILLPAAGLFFSIIFPTATAIVSQLQAGTNDSLLGLFFAFAGVGGMIGPWSVGKLSDLFGIRLGLAFVLVYCAVIVLSLMLLKRRGVS